MLCESPTTYLNENEKRFCEKRAPNIMTIQALRKEENEKSASWSVRFKVETEDYEGGQLRTT